MKELIFGTPDHNGNPEPIYETPNQGDINELLDILALTPDENATNIIRKAQIWNWHRVEWGKKPADTSDKKSWSNIIGAIEKLQDAIGEAAFNGHSTPDDITPKINAKQLNEALSALNKHYRTLRADPIYSGKESYETFVFEAAALFEFILGERTFSTRNDSRMNEPETKGERFAEKVTQIVNNMRKQRLEEEARSLSEFYKCEYEQPKQPAVSTISTKTACDRARKKLRGKK